MGICSYPAVAGRIGPGLLRASESACALFEAGTLSLARCRRKVTLCGIDLATAGTRLIGLAGRPGHPEPKASVFGCSDCTSYCRRLLDLDRCEQGAPSDAN